MSKRVTVAAAVSTAWLAATWVALGPPDVSAAASLFNDAVPTAQQARAVATLICWAVIGAVAVAGVAAAGRPANQGQLSRRRAFRLTLIALGGTLVLGFGIAQRFTPSYTMCCADTSRAVQEANQLAR